MKKPKPPAKQPVPHPSLPAPSPAIEPAPVAPTEADLKDEEYRRALYMEHQKQAWSDCQSGSDEFDKSILTYSSAGLGVSLVFIKDIVSLAKAVGLPLLYASWIVFGLAILVTVLSFQLSVRAQEKHLQHLRKYYLERQEEFLNAPNWCADWVAYLKWVSGACFVLALAGTIGFSIWNLTEVTQMSKNDNTGGPVNLHEGRSTMSMTPVNQDLGKGRGVGAMTPVQPAAPQTAPQPAPPAKK